MHALLAGASGLVGRSLLDLLLDEPRVERVTALVRRPLGRTHPKLVEGTVNFDELEQAASEVSPTHAFCCLGTTIRKAGSQDAFRRVDHDYPLALGRAAAKTRSTFLIVTAVGADADSSIFYNRVKGELERDLRALDLPSLHILRPSLLLGEREDRRPGERIAQIVAKPLAALFVGPLRRHRPIQGETVARALLVLALSPGEAGCHVHESDRIAELGAQR